jgi:hypothetical protein
MSTGFLEALDNELAGLERELQSHPVFLKWRELQRVRALYDPPTSSPQPAATTPWREDRRSSAKKGAVLRAAAERLSSASPTPTADLLAMLQRDGISVPGAKPQNYLSALLSHDAAFESHGRAGWTVAAEHAPQSNGASHEPAPSPGFESGSEKMATGPSDLLNQPAN